VSLLCIKAVDTTTTLYSHGIKLLNYLKKKTSPAQALSVTWADEQGKGIEIQTHARGSVSAIKHTPECGQQPSTIQHHSATSETQPLGQSMRRAIGKVFHSAHIF